MALGNKPSRKIMMNLSEYVSELLTRDRSVIPLAGFIESKPKHFRVYPKIDDRSVVFIVPYEAVISDPVAVAPPNFLSTNSPLHVIGVRSGSMINVLEEGQERAVEMTKDTSQSPRHINARSEQKTPTRCLLICMFECGSGRYISTCLGLWEC